MAISLLSTRKPHGTVLHLLVLCALQLHAAAACVEHAGYHWRRSSVWGAAALPRASGQKHIVERVSCCAAGRHRPCRCSWR